MGECKPCAARQRSAQQRAAQQRAGKTTGQSTKYEVVVAGRVVETDIANKARAVALARAKRGTWRKKA